MQKKGIKQMHGCVTLLRSKENGCICARWVIWSVEPTSLLIPFLYIFHVTLEVSPAISQSGTAPEMCEGEISNKKDVEVFDIMLTQSLLSEKLLVACLIKVNIASKLRIVPSHCYLAPFNPPYCTNHNST